jgi:Putative transposase
VLDGVFSFPVGRTPVFHPTPAPRDEDVARVVTAVFRGVERKLADLEPSVGQRRFAEDAPLLMAMAEASARGVVGTGPRRGCRIIRIRGAPVNVDVFLMGRLCAQIEGYDLQAATRLAANDRDGLERMARYLARPPIATDRLSLRDDGRLELRLKRPWRDGTTAFVFQPHELIERLVAIVPRPRAHLDPGGPSVAAPGVRSRYLLNGSSPVLLEARWFD